MEGRIKSLEGELSALKEDFAEMLRINREMFEVLKEVSADRKALKQALLDMARSRDDGK